MSAPEPEFSTVQEADAAYFGTDSNDDGDGSNDDGSDGPDGSDSTGWGELQTIPTDWIRAWTLGYQVELSRTATGEVREGDRRRYFVFRVHPETGSFQALKMSGAVVDDVDGNTSLDDVPSTESEDDARRAYQSWADDYDAQEGDDPNPGEDWGEWQEAGNAGPWTIFYQEHNSEDDQRFRAASTTEAGETIYLQPDGRPGKTPHTYETAEEMQKALDNYAALIEDGDIPEGQRPTGNSPGAAAVNNADGPTGPLGIPAPLQGAVDAVGGPRNAAVVGGAAVGGLYLAHSQGYIDISEAIGQ